MIYFRIEKSTACVWLRDRPARFRFTVSKLLSGLFVAERVLLPIRSNPPSMLGQVYGPDQIA